MEEQDANPMAWLWSELAQRLGPDIEREIHKEYNARQRRYEKALQAQRRQRNAEADTFFRQKNAGRQDYG